MNQQLSLEESHENGLLDEGEYKALKSDLVQRLVSLESHVFEWSAPSFDRFVIEFPMFATLTKSEREKIKSGAVEKKFYKDEIIYEKNMTCQYVYIIMRGDVRDELNEDYYVKKGLGSILSFANVIGDDAGKCLSRAIA